MSVTVFDHRACLLGEGPLWHPLLKQMFWFDIINCCLHSQRDNEELMWSFDRPVSAAGWIDETHLLIADSESLFRFNLETQERKRVCELEADNPVTRSNDGRADPWGGFWIGTMGLKAEPHAGSIYRYYQGELRCLFTHLTVTNAICFEPHKRFAYYADTDQYTIWRQPLAAETGWPVGEPSVYLDFSADKQRPDGAICDQLGNVWVALSGGAKVVGYDPAGQLVGHIDLPANKTTCPAFAGGELNHLVVTSASVGLSDSELEQTPHAGKTFIAENVVQGIAEPKVLL